MSAEGSCPGCGDETTFFEGYQFGNLVCDSCGYMPKKSIRDGLRGGV